MSSDDEVFDTVGLRQWETIETPDGLSHAGQTLWRHLVADVLAAADQIDELEKELRFYSLQRAKILRCFIRYEAEREGP